MQVPPADSEVWDHGWDSSEKRESALTPAAAQGAALLPLRDVLPHMLEPALQAALGKLSRDHSEWFFQAGDRTGARPNTYRCRTTLSLPQHLAPALFVCQHVCDRVYHVINDP